MLGTTIEKERGHEDKHTDNKLITAYRKAYDCYTAACERYDRLVKAYQVLSGISAEKESSAEPVEKSNSLPYTVMIMKRMIEDAHIEKALIADRARECVRHLSSLGYEM